MTLIEFHEAAKAIVDKSALGKCTVRCSAELSVRANGETEYHYKVTAHPSSGMITSWQEPNAYLCNSPRLALERFQIAVNGRFDPPCEPEAITEIEEIPVYQAQIANDDQSGVSAITLTKDSEMPFVVVIESEPSDQQVHALWDHCLELTHEQLKDYSVIKNYSAIEGSRMLEIYSSIDKDMRLFSICLDMDGLTFSSTFPFPELCERVGLNAKDSTNEESEATNG